LETDFSVTSLKKNYSILICSDGLTNYVEEQDMLKIVKDFDVDKACDKLIKLANKNGGGDNISVVIAKGQ